MSEWITSDMLGHAKPNDRQVGGNHYKEMPIQPWDVMETTDLRTKRTRKVIIEALYPCYLFCQIQHGITDIHPIKKTDNVMRLVQFGGQLATVSDALITGLKSLEDAQGVHEHKHEYAPGDTVRVKSGPFNQYEAVINSLSKHDRAIIELIDSNKTVEIRLINLEPAA
jgi:transcription antitermination factor NusG